MNLKRHLFDMTHSGEKAKEKKTSSISLERANASPSRPGTPLSQTLVFVSSFSPDHDEDDYDEDDHDEEDDHDDYDHDQILFMSPN